jgi:hypothetical protein
MRRGHDRAGHALCTDAQSVNDAYRAVVCTREAEAHVIVAVSWVVPDRGANEGRAAAPAATAVDAIFRTRWIISSEGVKSTFDLCSFLARVKRRLDPSMSLCISFSCSLTYLGVN